MQNCYTRMTQCERVTSEHKKHPHSHAIDSIFTLSYGLCDTGVIFVKRYTKRGKFPIDFALFRDLDRNICAKL